MKANIWCVPMAEASRFAHEIIRADHFLYAHDGDNGPIRNPFSNGRVAILYTAPLPPMLQADGKTGTNRYLSWLPDDVHSSVDLHVVVEPDFSGIFIGRERLSNVDELCIVHDLQMEKDYLAEYEKALCKLDHKLAQSLTYGSFVARKAGVSLISTQIALMRRVALGIPMQASQVGHAAEIFELLAGSDSAIDMASRLQLLAKEFTCFVNVYQAPDILLMFVREFFLGALDYMRGADAYVRGPRGVQYQNLLRLTPAFAIHILQMLENPAMPADVRLLMIAETIRCGLGES